MGKYKDEEWLREQRERQYRDLDEIAEECGVSRRTISYFCNKYGIQTRKLETDTIKVEILCDECRKPTSKTIKYLKSRIRKGHLNFHCGRECEGKSRSREMLAEGENGVRMKNLMDGHKRFFATEAGKSIRSASGVKACLIQANNRNFRTSIEIKMAEELNRRGIYYEEQHNLGYKFLLDFFLPEYNIVIECDGDYWHNLPKAKARDKSKNAYIKACGFSLYRFWEREINADVEACVDIVLAEINAREAV